uniref:Uncharacterized protein n=1 Tax=Daucus carota subsp. sativus TaxID=79200 RepID=A0A175YF74_DAUCS
MDDLQEGCPLSSVAASSNKNRKGKSPRTPFSDLTNLTNCSSLKSTFNGMLSNEQVNINVNTKKGLAAACSDCVSRSPVCINLFQKADVHLPSRGLFSSENNNVNIQSTPALSGFNLQPQRFNTKTHSYVHGKRRKPGDEQQDVHLEQMPKQRTKKSRLHVPDDLSCITRNILTNQTKPIHSSALSTHLDDGESSFIADHELYDDFLGDDGIVMSF